MKIVNPFITSGYVGSAYFCDRENESKSIISALENGRNITLCSPRRYGKTALIHHCFQQINTENEYHLVYVDLMPSTSMNDFVRYFATAILQSEKRITQKLITAFLRAVNSLRVSFTLDPISGQPSIDILFEPNANLNRSVEQIFGYIRNSEKQYIIAFDEFQQIAHYPETNMEAILRTEIQKTNNAGFIYSGSQKHLLLRMFSDYSRPFYQSSDYLHLSEIDEKKYEDFIIGHFAKANISIDEDAIRQIFEITLNHTWYVQHFCNKLYSLKKSKIDMETIRYAINSIIAENEFVFIGYRNLLSTQQYKLLKAIALEEKMTNPFSKDFIKKHDLSTPSTIKTSLDALLYKELIYENMKEYRIYDVYFMTYLQING